MKYYEVNGPGNELGPLGLACPRCGNCTLVEVTMRVTVQVFLHEQKLQAQLIYPELTDEEVFDRAHCPQCHIPMWPWEEIVDRHVEDNCPGCVVCTMVDDYRTYNVCSACVLQNGPMDCTPCKYNYAREQAGIDPYEILEANGKEYGYGSWRAYQRQQLELFHEAPRRSWRTTAYVKNVPLHIHPYEE